MVTTSNSPFEAPGAQVLNDEETQVNEKRPQTIETTRNLTGKPSQDSMASATMVASTSSNEKPGLVSTASAVDQPRPSDISSPSSAHHNPFDTDIEAMITHTTTGGNTSGRKSMACRGLGDSQVWPGQSHWKKKAKERKMKRSCTCLSRLSKRNRLIARILIVLLVVGIAVGVGVGISKPLGAPIWGESNS